MLSIIPKTLFVVALLFVTQPVSAQWDPAVQEDSRLDLIFSRFSARTGVPLPSGISMQPYHVEAVQKFLNAVDSVGGLSKTDAELLVLLKQTFFAEKKLWGRQSEKGSFLLNLDLTGETSVSYKDSVAFRAKGIITPKISGNIGGLSFYTNINVWTEYWSDTLWKPGIYEPYMGQTYNLLGNKDSSSLRAVDSFRGGVSWNIGKVGFDFAVDNLLSGPAAHNKLILNAKEFPIMYVRMTLDLDWMVYSHVFGVLREMRDYSKFLHYHRVQVPLAQNKIILGFNASIVYGSTADSTKTAEVQDDILERHLYNVKRTIEPVYLIPFIPFAFAEHYTGDRDNVQISFDIEFRFPHIARWYGEFLLDDFTNPLTLFNDTWNNKWALTVGTEWFPLIGGHDLTLTAEYCRVEPWVYTHFRGISNNYEHYGSSLGAELGPNSAQIRGSAEYSLNEQHAFRLSTVNSRYNHNVRGGSIDDVYIYDTVLSQDSTVIPPDSDKKEFLSGDVQTEYHVELTWLFNQYHRYEMETSIAYTNLRGFMIGLWGGFRF